MTTIVAGPAVRPEIGAPLDDPSAIVAPGPTEASSFVAVGAGVGVGVGVGAAPTVNEPFMDVACASQTKMYVPAARVTVKVKSPVCSIGVATSTPGP